MMIRQQIFLPGANRLALRIATTRRERPHRDRARKEAALKAKLARVASESAVLTFTARRKE